jgi:hypothetical protein
VVAGQSVVRPPAIDLEAANHIEKLEMELERTRRPPPARLAGQQAKDIPWRRVQPDAFCTILKADTVFDGDEILRTWNAMRSALLSREIMPISVNTNAEITAVLTGYGAEVFNEANACIPAEYRPKTRRAGDEYKGTLWSAIQIFGPTLYMGNTHVPFKDNTFQITDTHASTDGR